MSLPNNFLGFDPRIGVFKSCLCLFDRTELWVMKEYGVVASWIKLLDVSSTHNYGLIFIHDLSLKMLEDSLVLLGSKESFLLVSEARELKWFNYMKFTGSEDSFQVVMTFVDSLISLKQGEQEAKRRKFKEEKGQAFKEEKRKDFKVNRDP